MPSGPDLFLVNKPEFPFIVRDDERWLLTYKAGGCGIYQIFNLINGKIYIGSSKEIAKRMRSHAHRLIRGSHPNLFLQRTYDFSEKHLVFSVIETCRFDELETREEFYIDLFQTRSDDFGYNLQSAHRDDSANRWNSGTLSRMSDSRKAFFKRCPDAKSLQVNRLKSYWSCEEHKNNIRHRLRKVRKFKNRVTGEVFEGGVREIVKLHPDQNLDRAALLRVSNGKKRVHKNWISIC